MTNHESDDFYPSLRRALTKGLDRAERDGTLPEDTLADLVRVAVGLSLPILGAKDTIIALRGLTRQLEEGFPEDKKKADEHFEIWDRTRGNH